MGGLDAVSAVNGSVLEKTDTVFDTPTSLGPFNAYSDGNPGPLAICRPSVLLVPGEYPTLPEIVVVTLPPNCTDLMRPPPAPTPPK